MTTTQAMGFITNIAEFALLEYYFRFYLKVGRLSVWKVGAIMGASILLFIVNLTQETIYNVSAFFLLTLGYAFIFGNSSKMKKIAFSIVYVSISAMAEMVCMVTLAAISTLHIKESILNTVNYYWSGVIGKVILLAVIMVITRKFPSSATADEGFDILILSLFPATVVVTMLVIIEYDIKKYFAVFLLTLFFLFQTIMVFFIYNRTLQKKDLERTVQLNNEMRSMNELLFEQQRKEMESLLRLKHEFKRHMFCIFDYLASNKNVQASEYCKKLLGEFQLEEKTFLLLDFNNFTVSNIYVRFVKRCKDLEINYTADIVFKDFAFMKDLDSSVLFNNLFDNALEACEKVSENRWVDLKIHYLQENIIIKLSNSIGYEIKKSGHHFLSAKRMYSITGMGISQMLSIAEEYNGYVTCDYDSEKFETIIRIPFFYQ